MNEFIRLAALVAALALAAPGHAQTLDVLVATGPGVAGAAQSLRLTGAITGIDAETRTVTLTGEGGGVMNVVAGPEVKNFAELAVGDRVDLELTKALSLELRKGSTAAVSRTDVAGKASAPPGAAPGGVVGHKVVVMAEVTALDPEKRSVTLTGPQRSLELTIADPAQFAAIALGDRVEATYVEAIAVAVTPARMEQ